MKQNKTQRPLKNYSLDVLFDGCILDEKVSACVKATKEALTKRIIDRYMPEKTFESALDHGFPFDDLKEHQFMDAVRLAYIEVFNSGEKKRAFEIASHYHLFEYYA